jgi:hypothetical protein
MTRSCRRGLAPEEAREVCRSLKGTRLRQEIYALDRSAKADIPYSITEGNATIRLLQSPGPNLHSVFFVHPREALSLNLERTLYKIDGALRIDPRVTHTSTLEVDPYGNPLLSASIAHGRRFADCSELLSDADREIQAALLATVTQNRYTNAVDLAEAYRTPLVAEARAYELVDLPHPRRDISRAGLLRFGQVRRLVAQAGDGLYDLPFEDFSAKGATGPGPYRRLIEARRTRYRSDDLRHFLPTRVILGHLHHPLDDPGAILGNATTRLLYDAFAFDRTRGDEHSQPAVTCSLSRETHVSDLAPGARTKVQQAFCYSDGFGREAQHKLQAEPGQVPRHGGVRIDPRWVGSGWTIFNNKGNPVRQYEPFFSATHGLEFAATIDVSATLIYDPVGRAVATLNADHTFQKTMLDPWRQEIWDSNDTVLLHPGQDPAVGPLIGALPEEDYLPTWYQQREDGAIGTAQVEAATKAAVH